jgi:hypothetical protein
MLSLPTMFFLCAFAAVTSKAPGVAEEYVDLIELNHFYDHHGRHVYDQVIFYEQAPETGRFLVRAWCLVEDREALNRRPVKNVETQMVYVDWYDNDHRTLRKLSSHLYRESWTQIDPERANKKVYDERLRTALIQAPKRTADPASQIAARESRSETAAPTEMLVQR